MTSGSAMGFDLETHKVVVGELARETLDLLKDVHGLSLTRALAGGVNEALERLSTGRFAVAFVGQMKAGKSTLVNAMVLGKQILPVASTPQTAKLTVIQHAGEPSATVRFYTREEWDELEELSRREAAAGGETAFSYGSMIADARTQVGAELDGLLGTTRDIELDALKDYVAAYDPEVPQGKYVSVTHTVIVRHPHHWPQQVDFVDTPGINDPNILRERVTLDYLRRADAVILVLYAGRPGDREDIQFLKRTLLPIGFNRIIVTLNKWDMVPEAEGKSIRSYLREMLQENVIESAKRNGIDLPAGFEQILDLEHIYPISGMRALLGRSEAQIPDGKFYFKRTCLKKGIKTYEAAVEASGVLELEKGLLNFLMEQKGRELLAAPLRKAEGAAREVVRRAEQARERSSEQLADMQLSEDEIYVALTAQKRKLREIEASVQEIKVLLRRWIRQQMERAQKDGVRRVKSFVTDIQQSFMRRIDMVGAFDAATNQAHILELNTDMAWRVRALHDELDQVMHDGLIRLRRRLQGDLQDEVRQRIPDYTSSPWIMEEVDAIGRMEFPVALPPLAELQEDDEGFWIGVRQLMRAAEYRAQLKDRLRTIALNYERECLAYVKSCPDEIEEGVMNQTSVIIDQIQGYVQDRVDDLQRSLATQQGQMEEVSGKREALIASVEQNDAVIATAKSLVERIEAQRVLIESLAREAE